MPQFSDIVDRTFHAVDALILDAEFIDSTQAKTNKYRIVFFAQLAEREILAQRHVVLQFNAAYGEYVVHLALREVVDRFIRGDTVLVQAARLCCRG